MKTAILITVFAATAVCGWAADDHKTLKVSLDIADYGDTIMVYGLGESPQTFIGKNGKFEFELQVDSASNGIIFDPGLARGEYTENSRLYRVPFVGGETMRLTDKDRTRYDVDGTGFYAEYHKVDLFNENIHKELNANAKKFVEMKNDASVSEAERKRFYEEVYLPSFNACQQALKDYIKANPTQEAAVTLLREIEGLDAMREAFASFAPSVREGRMRTIYNQWVQSIESQEREKEAEKAAAKKQAAGIEAPKFTLNDINGRPLALESLRGKYVVLDFWGSWCGWCIKGFPKMKEYYAKYPGKFEILGIDCSDTEAKWKEAVEKHQLPWLHVYCPRESSVLEEYGITGFPTKIILGPDGKIVKTIVGEDPAFYTFLDELFEK